MGVFVAIKLRQPRRGVGNLNAQLFHKLALQRGKFRFARFHFAAGKFPIARIRLALGAR